MLVVAAIAVVALVMGLQFRREVLAADAGTPTWQTIGAAVEEGAQAYLQRQFKTLGGLRRPVFFLLLLLPADTGVKVGRRSSSSGALPPRSATWGCRWRSRPTSG